MAATNSSLTQSLIASRFVRQHILICFFLQFPLLHLWTIIMWARSRATARAELGWQTGDVGADGEEGVRDVRQEERQDHPAPAPGAPGQDESHSSWLVDRGVRGVQTTQRDILPRRGLHRQIPRLSPSSAQEQTPADRSHVSLHCIQDRGDLPSQAAGVRLRDWWSLHRGGDPPDGADDTEGFELGTVPHDTKQLDENLPADLPRIQETIRWEVLSASLLRPPLLPRHAAGGPLHARHRESGVLLQHPRSLRSLTHWIREGCSSSIR